MILSLTNCPEIRTKLLQIRCLCLQSIQRLRDTQRVDFRRITQSIQVVGFNFSLNPPINELAELVPVVTTIVLP